MKSVLSYFLPLLLLAPAVPAASQGLLMPPKSKTLEPKEVLRKDSDSLSTQAPLESVIPQKASLKEPLKKRKAVVIVPAPPPPPGPDPVPPKNP